MEKLVRLALQHFNSFRSQAALSGKWEQVLKDEDQHNRIHLAKLRVEMVQNWLSILTDDERFAIEQHLIRDLEWPRIVHVFGKQWDDLFFRSDRQLGSYQASGLKKIISYCKTYEDIIRWLFADLDTTEHLLGMENAKAVASKGNDIPSKRPNQQAHSPKSNVSKGE